MPDHDARARAMSEDMTQAILGFVIETVANVIEIAEGKRPDVSTLSIKDDRIANAIAAALVAFAGEAVQEEREQLGFWGFVDLCGEWLKNYPPRLPFADVDSVDAGPRFAGHIRRAVDAINKERAP